MTSVTIDLVSFWWGVGAGMGAGIVFVAVLGVLTSLRGF
jgi:hypothetical protein